MKERFLFAAVLAFSAAAYAQTGINTENPAATLDVTAKSTTDPSTPEGLLIPRLSKDNLDAKTYSPAASAAYGSVQNGALVFVNDVTTNVITDTSQTADVTATGFYYYDSTAGKWVKISGAIAAAAASTVWYSGTPVADTSSSTAATGYTGAMSHNDDIYANYVRVGRGNGNDDTNTVAGKDALLSDQPNATLGEGINNTAVGASALNANTIGHDNTAVGYNTLTANIGTASTINPLPGNYNVAVGSNALTANQSGGSNVAVGSNALTANQSGGSNVAVGYNALNANTSSGNVAVGGGAMATATGGTNTAVGYGALATTTGSGNTAIGYTVGQYTTGNNNLLIGAGNKLTEGRPYNPDNTTHINLNNTNDYMNIGNVIFGRNINGENASTNTFSSVVISGSGEDDATDPTAAPATTFMVNGSFSGKVAAVTSGSTAIPNLYKDFIVTTASNLTLPAFSTSGFFPNGRIIIIVNINNAPVSVSGFRNTGNTNGTFNIPVGGAAIFVAVDNRTSPTTDDATVGAWYHVQ